MSINKKTRMMLRANSDISNRRKEIFYGMAIEEIMSDNPGLPWKKHSRKGGIKHVEAK